jgi:hypothetical protein
MITHFHALTHDIVSWTQLVSGDIAAPILRNFLRAELPDNRFGGDAQAILEGVTRASFGLSATQGLLRTERAVLIGVIIGVHRVMVGTFLGEFQQRRRMVIAGSPPSCRQ